MLVVETDRNFPTLAGITHKCTAFDLQEGNRVAGSAERRADECGGLVG